MRNLYKIAILIFATTTLSCFKIDGIKRKAVNYNKEAMDIVFQRGWGEEQVDSALFLLNKAVKIDPNFYLAHSNKIMMLIKKKDYDQMLITNKEMQRLAPDEPYLVIQEGLFYELKGDSLNSNLAFKKGVEQYDFILKNDTNIGSGFKFIAIQSLVVANEEEKAKLLLIQLKEENPENEMLQNYNYQTKREFLEGIAEDLKVNSVPNDTTKTKNKRLNPDYK